MSGCRGTWWNRLWSASDIAGLGCSCAPWQVAAMSLRLGNSTRLQAVEDQWEGDLLNHFMETYAKEAYG